MEDKEEMQARLAYWIRYYRKKSGLSQSELAVLVGVDTRQIGRIEQKVNMPSAALAYHLAEALKVSMDDLFRTLPA